MTDTEKSSDPCDPLPLKENKPQRIFKAKIDKNDVGIVCHIDPTTKKYKTLAIIDNQNIPIAINKDFVKELEKGKKT